MRLQVPWHTLLPIKVEEHQPQFRTFKSQTSSSVSTESVPTIDLRGKRVDESIDQVEKWLDDRMKEGCDQVKIIHGFGTEQLKKAVRQYLSKSPYVSRWNPGDTTSGGDGITWVHLSD